MITPCRHRLLEARTYTPFGDEEYVFTTAAGGYNRYGYTGHERDPETGLIYAKARYYDSDLGVFTGVDPVLGQFDRPPSLHRYLYGYHNPILYTDPTGQKSVSEYIEDQETKAMMDDNMPLATAFMFLRFVWEVVGVESLTKVIDRVLRGKTEELTAWDVAGAILDALPVGKLVNKARVAFKNLMKAEVKLTAKAAANVTKKTTKAAKGAVRHVDEAAHGADEAAKEATQSLEEVAKSADEVSEAAEDIKKIDEKPSGKAQESPTKRKEAAEEPQKVEKAEPDTPEPKKTTSTVTKEKASAPETKGSKTHAERRAARKEGVAQAKEAAELSEKTRILKEAGFSKAERRKLIENNVVCFVAGTQVLTDEGLKAIEEIQVGDWVLSRDEQTGAQCYQTVLETIVTHPDTLVHVRYRDGNGDEQELITTTVHPFWVLERRDWIFAENLKPGYTMLQANGQRAEFLNLTIERGPPGEPFTTYNLSVSTTHTYYVAPIDAPPTASALWVHNSGGECKKIVSRKAIQEPTGDQLAIALSSAESSYKGTTKLGHALSKHVNRSGGSSWGKLTGAQHSWHEQALKQWREVMNGPGDFEEVIIESGVKFLEKRLSDGRGIRLNLDFSFKGLVD